ncbi:MAG: hypothetical protein KF813_10040 [Trueperaceae bacterium]|nr:hypothetical protein [Trueperaceae bacterium]
MTRAFTIWTAVAALLCACSLVLILMSANAQTTEEEAWETVALVAGSTRQASDGAVLFAHHCSACHGDTGGGIEEARLSFPESHRDCTRCHKPNNPSTMLLEEMTPRNAFNVGLAPPLVGPGFDLSKYGSGAGLYAYVHATMPRPFPAALDEDTYLAIVAFLMAANGVELSGELSAPSDLADFSFR